mgnify:CR=1 FL=1
MKVPDESLEEPPLQAREGSCGYFSGSFHVDRRLGRSEVRSGGLDSGFYWCRRGEPLGLCLLSALYLASGTN